MPATSASSASSAPLTLSPEDFRAAVLDANPRIAVFDCDGTLWSGDAGSAFMYWSIQEKLIAPDRVAWLNERYAGYKRGEVSEAAICGEMVQVYRGLTEATLRAAAATFFDEHVQHNIFPELADLIATLQARNCELWAVSSTNDWVIEEGARRFGISADRVLAARVHVRDGVITDDLIDVPTDEGKVAALRNAGIITPDAVFGNSVHDAAMLSIARRAFPVNPSPELAARSRTQGWPVFYPAPSEPDC